MILILEVNSYPSSLMGIAAPKSIPLCFFFSLSLPSQETQTQWQTRIYYGEPW